MCSVAAAWAPEEQLSKASRRGSSLRRFLRRRTGVIALVLLLLCAGCAYLGPWIYHASPTDTYPFATTLAPSRNFPFGTDELGRDVFSRIIYGARVSLQVGAISVLMALVVGLIVGLIAGFYGGADEVGWFNEHIEAGVTYANRPQGATTGAWPGYQAFGGWKGSGSTGKAIGSFYYLPQYLREQSQTVVE